MLGEGPILNYVNLNVGVFSGMRFPAVCRHGGIWTRSNLGVTEVGLHAVGIGALRQLFAGCELLFVSGSNCTADATQCSLPQCLCHFLGRTFFEALANEAYGEGNLTTTNACEG